MFAVTYIESNGATHIVEAPLNRTLMQIATDNAVPGILGDCGGACSCATCHAYLDPQWLSKLPPKSESEAFMLDGVPDLRESSRLCCQIPMREELNGMVIHLPVDQV
ncbi:MAG: 2Fe-2S iron-sulfur cluster-binding protein [Burkholderiaceae bacterium]